MLLHRCKQKMECLDDVYLCVCRQLMHMSVQGDMQLQLPPQAVLHCIDN